MAEVIQSDVEPTFVVFGVVLFAAQLALYSYCVVAHFGTLDFALRVEFVDFQPFSLYSGHFSLLAVVRHICRLYSGLL